MGGCGVAKGNGVDGGCGVAKGNGGVWCRQGPIPPESHAGQSPCELLAICSHYCRSHSVSPE